METTSTTTVHSSPATRAPPVNKRDPPRQRPVEEEYDDGLEAMFDFVDEDFCADGVPMEVDDGLAGSPESATFHN